MHKHSFAFEGIGTSWFIETSQELTTQIKQTILERVEVFDQVYSRFRTDSLVTSLRTEAGTYTFPDDSVKLINFYRHLYGLTDGKVTPLIGMALEKAGYDASYRLTPEDQSPLPQWGEAMEWDGPTVTTHQAITLDLGAAGKGYLVDSIADILETTGHKDYIIDASGDIRHRGKLENNVGLEDPRDPHLIIGVIAIENRSLCASATNRRAWGGGMHHIFDPLTLEPTRDVIATWVIADTTMIADGLATALFFVEPTILLSVYRFQYARMHSDYSIDYSPAFEGTLY